MVGPGSGVAPFRGFIQERAAQREAGEDIGQTILFYGCRRASEDWLYKEEWEVSDLLFYRRLLHLIRHSITRRPLVHLLPSSQPSPGIRNRRYMFNKDYKKMPNLSTNYLPIKRPISMSAEMHQIWLEMLATSLVRLLANREESHLRRGRRW